MRRLACGFSLLLVGCSTEEPVVPLIATPYCQSASGTEWPSRACAVVQGEVRDPTGRPLAGATVSVFGVDSTERTFLGIGKVDSTGTFRSTLHLLDRPPVLPVTIRARVIAVATGPYYIPPGTPMPKDSANVELTFVATGERYQTSTVALTLRLP